MFWKKEKSLKEIFIDTLRNSDIEWDIVSDTSYPIIDIRGGGFVFCKYFSQFTQDGRSIDSSIFWGVKKIAEESIMMRDIKKAGGYILDDDLRELINNTKKVLVASEQIEMLTSLIMKIREKYKK